MLLGNYHHARDHQVGGGAGADSSASFDHGSSSPSIPQSSNSPHQQQLAAAGLINPIPSTSSSKPDQSPPPHLHPHHQMLAAAAAGAPCNPRAAPGAGVVSPQQQQQERRLKPHSDQVLKCPRCDSMNTKFCYYNNYSLTQPRHFCKNCKRYWTKGGALRNVPVGGGCRKNKRVKQQQQQRQQDHQSQPQSQAQAQAPDDHPHHHQHHHGSPGGNPVPGLSLPGDGASSSSLEAGGFPAGFELPKSGGMSLTFDRLELPRGLFTSHPAQPPISINWAAAGHQMPPAFEGSILGLNLSGAIKQEPDMSGMFDPAAAAPGMLQQPQGLSSEMNSFVPMEGFNGEVLWRFPQQAPKLVSLLEDGSESHHHHHHQHQHQHQHQHPQHHRLIELEATEKQLMDLKQHKSKMSSSCTTSDYDQGGEDHNSSSPPEWHQSSEGFFDSGAAETGYWSNGGGAWSSTELHSYGAGQPPGNHQLL